MNGIIKQPAVDTYNTGSNSLASIYGLTAANNGSNGKAKQNGWDVLVREDETKGKSNRYNWNGSIWVDMETGVYGEDVAFSGGSKKTLQQIDSEKTDKETIIFENLLNNNLVGFHLDKRLGSNGGAFTDNSTLKTVVSCKGIFVAKDKPYTLSGSFFNYVGSGIRSTIATKEDNTGERHAPVWAVVENGHSFISPIDGYLFVDFELNTALTSLKSESQIQTGKVVTPYIPFGEVKLKHELLPENDYDEKIEAVAINQEKFETKIIVEKASKNLINPANVKLDRRYTISSKTIIAENAATICSSGLIAVQEGVKYAVSNVYIGYQGGYFGENATDDIGQEAIDNIVFLDTQGGKYFEVPKNKGIKSVLISLATNDERTAVKGNAQMEVGKDVTAYEPYKPKESINENLLPENDYDERITEVDTKQEEFETKLLITTVKNLINPANVTLDKRYTVGNSTIVSSANSDLGGSGLIEVKEGEWYAVSDIFTGYHGGYFGENANVNIGSQAIEDIVFTDPVNGVGKCFQVPKEKGVKYVYFTINTNQDASIKGKPQMEVGEMVTEYEPYNPVEKINPKLLPTNDIKPSDNAQLEKYTTFGNLSYPLNGKLPKFVKKWALKTKDVVVLGVGTSLTARSSEHCTLKKDATLRPPLMHSNNFASHIWDALKWDGQHYRRYDAKIEDVDFFTENGAWQTQSNIEDWDDGAYRDGITRYSDDVTSKIQFKVPIDAWQFNLIYRTDSKGSDNCKVSIAEGNGKMEVFNEANKTWVEANNYIFSQLEPPITRLPSITIIDPYKGTPWTLTDFQVKGDTTYQKRLKMRCKSNAIDSRTVEKNITISRTSGRLSYWGVEWSVREFMITYINSARGSHTSGIAPDPFRFSLSKYQDNEVWSFKPDLILSEDPIHNAGGSGVTNFAISPTSYFAQVTETFFFADNHISFMSRAADLGLEVPEFMLFNSSLTWNFNGINEDGTLKIAETKDGKMWSALDAQMSCFLHTIENHPDVVYINAVKHFVDACIACYGNMKDATVGSGKDGKTFTNESSHWNDTGCRVMARAVLASIDFLTR